MNRPFERYASVDAALDFLDQAEQACRAHAARCRECFHKIIDDEGNPGPASEACAVGALLLRGYNNAENTVTAAMNQIRKKLGHFNLTEYLFGRSMQAFKELNQIAHQMGGDSESTRRLMAAAEELMKAGVPSE